MHLDWTSLVLGVIIFPSLLLVAWGADRAKKSVLNYVRSATPTSPSQRAAFAARVYASRKVLVLRFFDWSVALTLGRSYAEEQRAANVLLREFSAVPEPRVRIRGRTW